MKILSEKERICTTIKVLCDDDNNWDNDNNWFNVIKQMENKGWAVVRVDSPYSYYKLITEYSPNGMILFFKKYKKIKRRK